MTASTSSSGIPRASRIPLNDRTCLVDLSPAQRFMKFDKIDWNRAFFKTYQEKRTLLQLLVHFNHIWVIHNSRDTTATMTWSTTVLGGAVSTIIMILATLAEFTFITTTWNNTSHLSRRLMFLLVALGLTSAHVLHRNRKRWLGRLLPAPYPWYHPVLHRSYRYAILPSGRMFGDRVAGKSHKYLASQTFTASYPTLTRNQRIGSIALWTLFFGCKATESYFYLALLFKDPVHVMVGIKIQQCDDRIFGNALRTNQAAFTLAIVFIVDLTLFFLDTYLWYVIWNTTPLKDIFTRLPKRIYAKILVAADMEVKYKPKVLVSQVWNAIIISMYCEHLLLIDHVQKLLYHQVQRQSDAGRVLPRRKRGSPPHLVLCSEFDDYNPGAAPVDAMPTFTVLTPHYLAKILLSLREIIREEDQNTSVTLLEYLKQLHPIEWENFVKDTMILAKESAAFNRINPFGNSSDEQGGGNKTDDLPFYAIGFKSAAPEFTLRTRIWASLRAQTLYRTVSGMMNYAKAIKLLYRVGNPEVVQLFGGNTEKLEHELGRVARRKFKFVISMQRYSKFNKEQENAEFMLRAYPDLQIAYLDEEPSKKEGGEPRLFLALIDGHSELMPKTGHRRSKFRIELLENPILGDGKSDDQNREIIFYRGEYLRLIDVNQDNYLEECLKIHNVLGEFEQYHTTQQSPYAQWGHKEFQQSPVAIVEAREYIFSENIGILGDVAGGKEQTFGTLAWIGGKLHYGHPDFLNATFMSTRGGVSKAQKGPHLNEDIFANMNAFGRGGRIKHTEYFQCGKGRDLGFGTVLNFQTKLGNGMPEQMLSREYYYLGTQLPINRFLSFYYGHPGFHINNILVILSAQVFILALLFLVDNQRGCYNLLPVFDWIKRCIISIFLVFAIAFLPLFLQELTERGTGRALLRLAKHFLSLSPIFEVFSTQIQSNSIITNTSFGGARYIATGRGFATTRISFSTLYSRLALSILV
ncbi:beta-1,3-glucan synthase [Ceratobasidium sp. AG-Ba]|nr:beta-1,3-glucan synthase [Ceratobasidium sp. AG-Ba]